MFLHMLHHQTGPGCWEATLWSDHCLSPPRPRLSCEKRVSSGTQNMTPPGAKSRSNWSRKTRSVCKDLPTFFLSGRWTGWLRSPLPAPAVTMGNTDFRPSSIVFLGRRLFLSNNKIAAYSMSAPRQSLSWGGRESYLLKTKKTQTTRYRSTAFRRDEIGDCSLKFQYSYYAEKITLYSVYCQLSASNQKFKASRCLSYLFFLSSQLCQKFDSFSLTFTLYCTDC